MPIFMLISMYKKKESLQIWGKCQVIHVSDSFSIWGSAKLPHSHFLQFYLYLILPKCWSF